MTSGIPMDPEVTLGAKLCAPSKDKPGPDNGERGEVRSAGSEPLPARSGKAIRREDLPPPGVTCWVIRRKAQVVAAVDAGVISLEEVCRRYSVSLEEFASWQSSMQRHGVYGLR